MSLFSKLKSKAGINRDANNYIDSNQWPSKLATDCRMQISSYLMPGENTVMR
jgi:hypothetical protein